MKKLTKKEQRARNLYISKLRMESTIKRYFALFFSNTSVDFYTNAVKFTKSSYSKDGKHCLTVTIQNIWRN